VSKFIELAATLILADSVVIDCVSLVSSNIFSTTYWAYHLVAPGIPHRPLYFHALSA